MNLLELFAPIRTFVFGVDEVCSLDGNGMIMQDGHMLRRVSTRDDYALQQAVKKGYKVWVLSGAHSEAIRLWLNKLGINEVHMGVENTKELLQEITIASKTAYETILYMGADIPDYAAMQLCDLPCCPNDAVPEIKQIAKYISPYSGGNGCVRDVIEKVLKLNGDWELPV